MLKVNIKISGDKETVAKLKKMGKSFKEWRPELERVGDYMVNFYSNAVFETEGGIFGLRWAGLSRPYDFWKRKNFGGRGTLQRTGTLRRGFSSDASNTEVTIKNRVPYGVFHQYGTRKMPARPIMHVDQPRINHVIKIFEEGLARKLAAVI